jgi:hypothetical protein
VVEDAARLAHDVTKLDFDPLKVGINPRAAFALECGQQPIPASNRFSVPSMSCPQKSSQRANATNRKPQQDVKVAVRVTLRRLTLQQATRQIFVLLVLSGTGRINIFYY